MKIAAKIVPATTVGMVSTIITAAGILTIIGHIGVMAIGMIITIMAGIITVTPCSRLCLDASSAGIDRPSSQLI
jgi:hypothetical protein